MRTFGASFTAANSATEKSPRFVIEIEFDSGLLWLTSHAGIQSIPAGVTIENVLQGPTAESMRIVPDEGRSEIGAMSFSAIDPLGALTAAFNEKLEDGENLRGKIVRFHLGYSAADFSQYVVFQTQVIRSASYSAGRYSIKCADITREQRRDIFEPKRATLKLSAGIADTTIAVYNTAGFETVEHGAGWQDAPNATVGYIQIEDEIIRWTGKTGDSFTGCTRGVLNTRAAAHAVDLSQKPDQQTRVEEYIYLDLPAPKLALAVLTGRLYNQGSPVATLPEHWHLGIDPDQWINLDDFFDIGADLWDTENEQLSFFARGGGLKKVDGKQFLEKEVYMMTGLYPVTYSDGRIGIKRMNRILADAPYNVVLDENVVVEWDDLTFDMEGMHNTFRVDWNYLDGEQRNSGFTRTTLFRDQQSIDLHGETDVKALKFKLLFGSRHTDANVRARINALRDRYSHPPARMRLRLLPSMNPLEVGDIVRVRLNSVRDYAGNTSAIDRSFEVQKKSVDYATGEVIVDLFGSTGLASTQSTTPGEGGEGPDGENSTPDGYYDDNCTELSTVVDITPVGDVGVTDPGTFNLTGAADLTSPAACYYYLGDLEISAGTAINITGNVRLQVRGFLTINGDVNGIGGGLAGVADNSTYGSVPKGTPGYFGVSRGMDGVVFSPLSRNPYGIVRTAPAATTVGQRKESIDRFDIQVVGGQLTGLPRDLRGTSGGPGGKVLKVSGREVLSAGGAGGDGGAGLCIICRGLAIGGSGQINLSGESSVATSASSQPSIGAYPGAGGAGAPGCLLILLDGSLLSMPDVSDGRVLCETGTVPFPGVNNLIQPSGGQVGQAHPRMDVPIEGYLDSSLISNQDWTNTAVGIQWIPAAQDPAEDAPSGVPAPTSLSATGLNDAIYLELGLPDFSQFDAVKIYAATTNDRSTATLVLQGKASTFTHYLGGAFTRYYWAQTERNGLPSEWYPTSPTGGVSASST